MNSLLRTCPNCRDYYLPCLNCGLTEAIVDAGLRDGQPCAHPGCLAHVSHACEGCGRTGGRLVNPWRARAEKAERKIKVLIDARLGHVWFDHDGESMTVEQFLRET
jgi:hypothetical protein